MYANGIKRMLDFSLALIALIILSPLLLIILLLVRATLGSPAIFQQKRVGKDEKVFTMYKFRTMTNAQDADGCLLPDQKRKTKLGNLLRSTCLDELPELINILKGDLAIVGPRPLLVEYLPYYTQEERLRHTVRGGLTQPEVLYNKVFPTWIEQFSYEVSYAKDVRFTTDAKIILKTMTIIFNRMEKEHGSYTRNSLIEERSGKTYEVHVGSSQ